MTAIMKVKNILHFEKHTALLTFKIDSFIGESTDHKAKQAVHSVLYGQFSFSDVPPKNRWVFLATDVGIKIQRSDHHGLI